MTYFCCMDYRALLKRITVNPQVAHGKPTIRNTRYLVESVLEFLAAGDTSEDILKFYPDLTKEDIQACIAYATEVLKVKSVSHSA